MSLQISNDQKLNTDQKYIINGGVEELNLKQDTQVNTLIKTGKESEEVFIRDTVDISEVGQGMIQKLIEPGTENFKSGYYEELSKVSSTFKGAFRSLVTNLGTGIAYKNIDYSSVDNIISKYNEIRKSIEDNYTGKEKNDKLEELSDAYAFTFNKNIIKPIELQIYQAKSDAEISEKMSGFIQRINEYHSTLGLGNSSGASVLNDVSKVSENIKQYQSLLDMLTDLKKNVIINENISSKNVKESLHNIISSIIEKVGTNEQKKEYASIDLMV